MAMPTSSKSQSRARASDAVVAGLPACEVLAGPAELGLKSTQLGLIARGFPPSAALTPYNRDTFYTADLLEGYLDYPLLP